MCFRFLFGLSRRSALSFCVGLALRLARLCGAHCRALRRPVFVVVCVAGLRPRRGLGVSSSVLWVRARLSSLWRPAFLVPAWFLLSLR